MELAIGVLWVSVAIWVAVAIWAVRAMGGGLKRALDYAHRSGEIAPLTDALSRVPEASRPTQWDFVIGSLWRAYRREQAAALVVVATAHTDADIVQYWIRQVLEVEPEIAQSTFTPEFLQEHFRPEVALRCGKKGCCG